MRCDGDAVMTARRGVFAADEQNDVAIDLVVLSGLMSYVLDEELVSEDALVSLTLVDESSIAALNEQFLDGSGPTDVLAFPIDVGRRRPGTVPEPETRRPAAPDDEATPPLMLGDVIVCPVVAARQAGDHDHTQEAEMALLVVHGTLHLLDYDHVEEADAVEMRRRERELLDGFRDLRRTEGV